MIRLNRYLGNLLWLLTLLSPLFAYLIIYNVADVYTFSTLDIIRYSWIMWLFIPIGVVSIFMGIRLKKNRQFSRKNFIVAYIIIPILFNLGGVRFAVTNVSYQNKDHIYEVMFQTQTSLPTDVNIITIKNEYGTLSFLKIEGEENISDFNIYIHENTYYWSQNFDQKLRNALPVNESYLKGYSYYLYYNVDTGEYRFNPYKFGTYECVFVAYDPSNNRMLIINNCEIAIHNV